MAKKKMGGLGKGLDSLFARPVRRYRQRSVQLNAAAAGKSSLTPSSPASGLTTTR